MICSITSSGFEIPPDQKSFQIRSILDLTSPVSTIRSPPLRLRRVNLSTAIAALGHRLADLDEGSTPDAENV